jgi:PBP1b-binding outer membrane lipoprotein LpoB
MKSIYLCAGLLALCLCFASCGSAGVHHKDAADVSQRRSTTEFDSKDIADVSAELAESLLSANILRNKGPDGRSVIVISTFRNNTDLYDFDPNVIFNRIRVTLNKSGVAYCYATNDANVNENRASVAADNSVARAQNDDLRSIGSSERVAYRASGPSPQYTLSMELSVDHASVGRTTQKNYHIHMTLNDIRRNLLIWQDAKKISTRTSAGF